MLLPRSVQLLCAKRWWSALVMLAAMAVFSVSAEGAVTIAQWNFNSTAPDGDAGTGTLSPSVGSGTAALVGTSNTFADASVDGGSSDPATSDDSGWNLAGFAPQGTGSQTRGAQWLINTTGYGSITMSFDQRNSATSSRYWAVHYTLDGGTSWVPFSVTGGNTTAGLFAISAKETWFNGLAVDFSSVTGVADNPLFGVRVLSSFAPSTSSYSPTDGASYGTTGTARFDMVTFSGSVIPEPSRAMLMLFGLYVALWSRRRQAA